MGTLENEDPTTQQPRPVEQDEDPAPQTPEHAGDEPLALSAGADEPDETDDPSTDELAVASIPAVVADTLSSSADEQIQPAQIPNVNQATSADVDLSPLAFPDAQAATILVPLEQTPPEPHEQRVGVPLAAVLPVIPPMDFDDLISLRIASDPQISPDGTLVAYTLLECDGEADTTRSAIWLVESVGGKMVVPRQLTSGTSHDRKPRWSPDGQSLAFLSDRTGVSQLYLLTLNGGEARPLSEPSLRHGVTEFSWHPDGQIVLAHSPWRPQDEPHDRSSERLATVYTRLGTQWDGVGYKYGRHQQLWLIPLSGNAMRLTSEPVDLVQSCWSPDGQEVAFCANRRGDPDLSVSMALWILTLSSGQMRRLTAPEGLAQMPSWSPDGRLIAYLYTADQTEASNISPWIVAAHGTAQPRLAVTDADALTCQSWIIDELRDEYIAPPQWYPDSQSLLVPVQERGQLHLYRLDLQQQSSKQLTSGNGRYLSPQLSRNGEAIAMVRADWFTPGDIWCMDSSGKQPRKLTRINDIILQSHRLTRPKRISWQSFDGQEIDGWLYLPQLPEDVKAPLILMVHGGPSLAWGDSYVHEFQVLAGRGYAVLASNPRGSAGYGEAFCRSVLNDWGGADLQDLLCGIDHVLATEAIEGQRLGIEGLSYGGYMTNFAITQEPARFKAAVSRNGISSIASAALLSDQSIWFNLSMDKSTQPQTRSALTYVDNIQTPLLLLHAQDDLRCPFSEAQQLFVALRSCKKTVELVGYHNTSHLMDWPGVGTPQQRLDRQRRTIGWYERFL
jgi:dipeptidyl aminopeptidase/acylaminoacyl peptidase